jgi:CheY-like chemotaxis protein
LEYKKILFIDDDVDDLELATSALQTISNELECITAKSATEALKQLESKDLDPDLIFLDLNMPVMTGQQFLTEMRKHEKLKQIPVVILSTSSNPSSIIETRELGAADYIIKPMKFSGLIELLRAAILEKNY